MTEKKLPVLIGEKVLWLGSGSGLPKSASVRWMGRLPEMGPGWVVGLELDEPLPYGGIDGTWGQRKLFQCEHKHGIIVPFNSVIPQPHRKVTEGSESATTRKEILHRSLPTRRKPEKESFEKRETWFGKKQHSRHKRTNDFESLPEVIYRNHKLQRQLSLLGTLRTRSACDVRRVQLETIKINKESCLYSVIVEDNQNVQRSQRMIQGRQSDDTLNRSSSINSSRSGGSRRDRSSGIFSFFKWFKKEKSTESESPPESPILRRANDSICGSVDTLFSTATANSFAFIHPSYYKPFGTAHQPEVRIALGPETNTYRNRIRQRDLLRQSERNISLREKYQLYASGTLPRSVDRINELNDDTENKSSLILRKKRKAPPPPPLKENTIGRTSLPGTLVESQTHSVLKHHRRAYSEPVKYVKVTCHVKGKRRAPRAPSDRTLSLRRKRRAPLPPVVTDVTTVVNDTDIEETASTASTADVVDVVSTDTLRLERGILKPNKMDKISEIKFTPSSPVSPRPWYKRNAAFKEQIRSNERKKERDRKRVEEWMLESGIPRRTSPFENRFNIFTRLDRPEDKRRSQISILTNISELDREAAQIMEKGKALEQAFLADKDAMFYDSGATNGFAEDSRKNTKELISMFNAITNMTQVTVNAAFLPESFMKTEERPNDIHRVVLDEEEIRIHEPEPQPGCSKENPKITRVTIQELDDFDAERSSKAQAMYEANRLQRHVSPPIPTISEVSEKASPSTSASSDSDPINEIVPSAAPALKSVAIGHLVWCCPRCTLENSRWKITCEACDMWRPMPCEFKPSVKPKSTEEIQSECTAIKTVEPKKELKPEIELKETNSTQNTGEFKPQERASSGMTISDLLFNTHDQPPAPKLNILNELDKRNCQKAENTVKTEHPDKPIHNNISDVSDKKLNVLRITEPTRSEDLEAEEVRKARLAFFHKRTESGLRTEDNVNLNGPFKPEHEKNAIPLQEITAKETQTPEPAHKPVLSNDREEDRKRLREMLKEIKHSLPKKTKEVKTPENKEEPKEVNGAANTTENIYSTIEEVVQEKKESPKLGAVAKVLPVKKPIERKYERSDSDKAEAYLIESETVVEEIKIRKPSEKVSSSAQTSALVRQIAPPTKPPTGREFVVPMTVEEYQIKGGVLYTSVSKGAKKIGSGTFELMRPRDFANIKAVKSGDLSQKVNMYANVPNSDSSCSQPSTSKATEVEKLSEELTLPQGLANFRADLSEKNEHHMNTIAVNRLLRRLESAIANGQHELAAALAKELAQLKVNCSVTRHKPETMQQLMVNMYIEDRQNHQGPYPLKVNPTMTVEELKVKIEREYEIPCGVQRWILGNVLAQNEKATLEAMGIVAGTPIYLYLVVPDQDNVAKEGDVEKVIQLEETLPEKDDPVVEEVKDPIEPEAAAAFGWKCDRCTLFNCLTRLTCAVCESRKPLDDGSPPEVPQTTSDKKFEQEKNMKEEDKRKSYQKLIDLEKNDIIVCTEAFECPICFVECEPFEGVVLRECLHTFCKICLMHTIQYSDEAEVKCPFRDDKYTCDSTLLEREIKALVTPEAYEVHLAKSIALAETKIGNTFHCKTPDCKGWCIYEDNVNLFRCPVCTHMNCLTCQAIHEGLDCKQFQEQLHTGSDTNADSKRTREMLQEMVDRGEAMNCPTCQVILMKKWGCDWLRCSMCKTEICWITRGPRWGPNGKGDTSGGCQCGINGIKCHPKCTYCH